MEETDFEVMEWQQLLQVPDKDLPFRFWLKKRMFKYLSGELSNGRQTKQSDYARYLGITPYNLSQYLTGNRKPIARIAQTMAIKLGPDIFNKLDLPRSIPKDKRLLWLVDHWHYLSETEQKEILERARNMKQEKEEREGRGENQSQFA